MRQPLIRFATVMTLSLAVLLGASDPASALVLRMELPELSRAADAVVVAKVKGSSVRAGSQGRGRRPLPMTATRLQVTRVIVGERSDAVEIVQPGGLLDGVRLTVSDMPAFEPGETCVLFLSKEDGIVGAFQGKLRVQGSRVDELGISVSELERRVNAYRAGADPSLAFEVPAASVSGLSVGAVPVIAPEALVTVASAPVITSITPSKQIGGISQTVTISGSGFGVSQGTGKVQFVYGRQTSASGYSEGQEGLAPVVSWSDTTIVVQVPRWACTGPLRVTTGAGMAVTHQYETSFSVSGRRYPGPVSYRINENCDGVTGEAAEIVKAFETWNTAGSVFRVKQMGVSTRTEVSGVKNDTNEIWFARLGTSGGLALNYQWSYVTGQEYLESDIIFNSDYAWALTSTMSAFDIQTVALHEVGHTVGLDDQYPNAQRVMAAATWGQNRRALSADDIAGAVFLHGTDTPGVPEISSSSHPAQSAWYPNTVAVLTFPATGPVAGYSYVMDASPATIPDDTIDTDASTATLETAQGERWFHVRAVSGQGVAGPVAHFRLKSDSVPPVSVRMPEDTFENTATVTLSASDAHSGVASTWYRLDGGAVTRYEGPFEVAGIGEHQLQYRSVDVAGNIEEFVDNTFRIVGPAATSILSVSSSSHPSQSAWHSAPQVSISYPAYGDVEGYSYVIDSSSGTEPDTVTETVASALSVPVAQGERWFHVRAIAADGSGGKTRHYRLLTDTTPPVTRSDAQPSYVNMATIRLSTVDAHSGVASTWYRLDGGPLTGCSGPIVVTAHGAHALTVHSVDHAGNPESPATIDFRVDAALLPPTTLVTDAAAWLDPVYGGSALIAVRLRGADGAGLANQAVHLETSAGDRVGRFLHVTDSGGQYVVTAPVVSSLTPFTVRFFGDAANAPSSLTVTVKPRAYLTRKVPTSARSRSRFVVTGVIRPAHGGAAVRVEVQKRSSSGSYRASGYSKTVKTSSTALRTALSLARGRYRVRLVHSDAGHARTATAWAYVRVR